MLAIEGNRVGVELARSVYNTATGVRVVSVRPGTIRPRIMSLMCRGRNLPVALVRNERWRIAGRCTTVCGAPNDDELEESEELVDRPLEHAHELGDGGENVICAPGFDDVASALVKVPERSLDFSGTSTSWRRRHVRGWVCGIGVTDEVGPGRAAGSAAAEVRVILRCGIGRAGGAFGRDVSAGRRWLFADGSAALRALACDCRAGAAGCDVAAGLRSRVADSSAAIRVFLACDSRA